MSFLAPGFVRRICEPNIKTVLLCGCGGGFDFVHGMVLYPELCRLGKRVIIGSYSFGDPMLISNASLVFQESEARAYKVMPGSTPDDHYGPEVHLYSFLRNQQTDSPEPFILAYYARAFTVNRLARFYQQIVDENQVDAVVLVDGGSDSLMVGDEFGLGDPVEDAVSVAAVARLKNVQHRLLLCIGLGADRFNLVSDSASLRAIAELTKTGGYLGSVGIEPSSEGALFYRNCIEYIFARQGFRSVLAGTIDAAIQGHYGADEVPATLQERVRPGELFLWPLMAMVWGFEVSDVQRRSLICQWIQDCETLAAQQEMFCKGRETLGPIKRGLEELPSFRQVLEMRKR